MDGHPMIRYSAGRRFGGTRFIERRCREWHHFDAEGKRLGGPYVEVWLYRGLPIALVVDRFDTDRIIDVRGRAIGETLLRGNRKHHKDGPGKIVWVGYRDKDVDLACAVIPDGRIIGPFEEIRPEPHEDVRWVRKRRGKRDGWRLLRADGRLIGPLGITRASDFFDGFSLVRIGGADVFLTAQGRRAWSGARSYSEAFDFFQGRAWVRGPEGLFLIGTDGKPISGGVYDDILDNDENPYAIARKSGCWHIVRRQDGVVVSPDERFDGIRRLGRHLTDTLFELCSAAGRETYDVATGFRRPIDLERERAMSMAIMDGGEYDD